jgi:hypothetical protein
MLVAVTPGVLPLELDDPHPVTTSATAAAAAPAASSFLLSIPISPSSVWT